MRILMLGIALLALTTFAFAAENTADNTSSGNIVLTVNEAYWIGDVVAGAMSADDFATGAVTGATPLTFNYKANHDATVSITTADSATGTWTYDIDSVTSGNQGSLAVVPTAGSKVAGAVSAAVSGIGAVNAGTYTSVVTLTIATRP